jgi:type II secretory pathway component GspD/PulD (secretin)
VARWSIFGRIPLIGDLLNSRSTEVSQYVRIYVVRPRILGEDSERVQALQAPQDPDDSRHPAFKDVPNLLRGSGMSPSTPAAR